VFAVLERRDKVIYYSYKADRARRTLHAIDEQVKKAQKAVDGQATLPVTARELPGAVREGHRLAVAIGHW
jgi:hypothetical protein